jgi:hypothetical protein
LINHALTRVEEEHAEVLLHVECVPCRELRAGDIDMEPLSLISRTEEDSPREFHRSAEADRIGRTNACRAALRAADKRCEAVLEHLARRAKIGVGANAASRKERDELRIAERRSTVSPEARSWMLVAR